MVEGVGLRVGGDGRHDVEVADVDRCCQIAINPKH